MILVKTKNNEFLLISSGQWITASVEHNDFTKWANRVLDKNGKDIPEKKRRRIKIQEIKEIYNVGDLVGFFGDNIKDIYPIIKNVKRNENDKK
jgi:hypothetical protein